MILASLLSGWALLRCQGCNFSQTLKNTTARDLAKAVFKRLSE
jgi:hypothetical protein